MGEESVESRPSLKKEKKSQVTVQAEKHVIKYERMVKRLLLGKMVISQQQEEQKHFIPRSLLCVTQEVPCETAQTMCQQRNNQSGELSGHGREQNSAR